MATYVISDIHGAYDKFMELLGIIGLKESDTLYILGDILDRGPHPIRIMQKLMEMPNAICIVGNHELMALECLPFLCTEITREALAALDPEVLGNILTWQMNGCKTTLDEFRKLHREQQQDMIDFMRDFLLYEELTVNGQDYLLVHGGLGNYAPDKTIEDYSIRELVWDRADYGVQYFEDVYVVTGHTPTQHIKGNPNPGFIFRQNNHIAIDCGAYHSTGRLAAICLDTGEEFYTRENV